MKRIVWNRWVALLMLNLVLMSCGGNDCQLPEEVKAIPIEASINRLDKQMLEIKSPVDAKAFVEKNQVFTNYMLGRGGIFPSKEIFANELYKTVNDKVFMNLVDTCSLVYADMSSTQKEITTLYKRLKHFDESFTGPEVNTFVSGFQGFDFYVDDKMVLIGLDYFLPKDSATIKKGYMPDPKYYPQYRSLRDTKEHIPSRMALFFSEKYNKNSVQDQTILADMIASGKALYFVEKMFPCIPEKDVVEYNDQEIEFVKKFEKSVYEHFVAKQLFFSQDFNLSKKYLDERPKVTEVADNCPGRIGQWLGWQIVRSYMKNNPDISLEALMAETDANKIFNQAKYRP